MQVKVYFKGILVILWGVHLMFFLTSCEAAENQENQNKIRKPSVAGSFYPANPAALEKMIAEYVDKAETPKIEHPVMGIVAPHAGYIYSGSVAAHAYALLQNQSVRRVVVISPSHVASFRGASIYDGHFYETPLGKIKVDRDFGKRLAAESDLIKLSAEGHETKYQGRGEHALEVQLPFLQHVLGDFELVPVVMGEQSYESCRALGIALGELIENNETIIVASSDLSHFHPYKEAVQLDKKVLRAIEEWDYYNLSRNCNARIWEACGAGPIVATMIAVEQRGANVAHLLKYANSGDVPAGNRAQVVGYAAFAFYKDSGDSLQRKAEFNLNEQEQEKLLNIAREAVHAIVNDEEVYSVSLNGSDALNQARGAFVTLKKKGRLRGCIGYTAPTQALCTTVRDAAIQSAVRDFRFNPVCADELQDLSFEISVLSPFRKVKDVESIVVGKHGLVIIKNENSGLLLPQVPVEQGWDRRTFLEQTCRKAGLQKDAWKDPETDIFQFTAFVFGED